MKLYYNGSNIDEIYYLLTEFCNRLPHSFTKVCALIDDSQDYELFTAFYIFQFLNLYVASYWMVFDWKHKKLKTLFRKNKLWIRLYRLLDNFGNISWDKLYYYHTEPHRSVVPYHLPMVKKDQLWPTLDDGGE